MEDAAVPLSVILITLFPAVSNVVVYNVMWLDLR